MVDHRPGKPSIWEVLTLTKRDVDRRTFLKTLAALGVTVTAGSLLEACVEPSAPSPVAQKTSGGVAKSGSQKEKVLVAGWPMDVPPLDPVSDHASQIAIIVMHLFERLVAWDTRSPAATVSYIPQLATSWKLSQDGMALTYELRKGVKFHDGTPFNAEAVKFNVDRVSKPDFQYYSKLGAGKTSIAFEPVAGVEVLDEHKLVIKFKSFNPDFIDYVATRSTGSIVSPDSVKKWGNDAITEHPVGTGTFKFVEYEKGVKFVVERNPDYWGPQPHLDRIVFRPIVDSVARVIALQNGEVDFIDAVPTDYLKTLKADQNLAVSTNTVPGSTAIQVNHREKPWSDPKVRQAANFAINREALGQIFQGNAEPNSIIVGKGSYGYDPDYKDPFPYDPQKARTLLSQAGYQNGFDTVFHTATAISSIGSTAPLMDILREQLAAVGIRVKWEVYETATLYSMMAKDMAPGVGGILWQEATNIPLQVYRNLDIKNVPPVGRNLGGYRNVEVEALLQKVRTTMDESERLSLYKKAIRIATEDATYINLYSILRTVAYRAKAKGFVNSNTWEYMLDTIRLED